MAAGYSTNSLAVKLGLKPGMRAIVVNPPEDYFDLLGDVGEVHFASALRGKFDFLHVFSDSKRALQPRWAALKRALEPHGLLWISWPKKTSALHRDLNENIVREQGLKAGLVDVKVCAIDEDWSGLKFVWRVKDR